MYKQLLWIFTQLSDDYIVLDTETSGLPDENGLPDIVTISITVVRNREIAESVADFSGIRKEVIPVSPHIVFKIIKMTRSQFIFLHCRTDRWVHWHWCQPLRWINPRVQTNRSFVVKLQCRFR